MRLNRGRPRAFPSILFFFFFLFVTRGEQDGHRDRIKALGLCRIDRYDRGMGFGRRGLRVIARRKRLERAVEPRASEREGVVYILSFISPGTPPKNHTRGRAPIVWESNSRLLDSSNAFPFSANKDSSFFLFLFFHFSFFPSEMKKRARIGER